MKCQVAETTVLFKELMKKHIEMEDKHAFTPAMKAQLDRLLNGPLRFSLADIGNMAGFIENKMQNIAIALPRIDKPYRDFLAEEVKHNDDGSTDRAAYRVRLQSLAGYTPHHRVPTYVRSFVYSSSKDLPRVCSLTHTVPFSTTLTQIRDCLRFLTTTRKY